MFDIFINMFKMFILSFSHYIYRLAYSISQSINQSTVSNPFFSDSNIYAQSAKMRRVHVVSSSLIGLLCLRYKKTAEMNFLKKTELKSLASIAGVHTVYTVLYKCLEQIVW